MRLVDGSTYKSFNGAFQVRQRRTASAPEAADGDEGVEDNRADLRTGTVQLLRTLHVLLGSALHEHAQRAPSAVQNRLADVIQTV